MSNKKPKNKLSPKQKQFVKEYIIDLNARQAYIRAGYDTKSAYSNSVRLIANDKIQEEIQVELKKRVKRTEITADMVIKELALLAFSDPADLYTDHGELKKIVDLPSSVSRTIQEVTNRIEVTGTGDDKRIAEIQKIKQASKQQALDSLGKHFGIFEKDNRQQQNNTTVFGDMYKNGG